MLSFLPQLFQLPFSHVQLRSLPLELPLLTGIRLFQVSENPCGPFLHQFDAFLGLLD